MFHLFRQNLLLVPDGSSHMSPKIVCGHECLQNAGLHVALPSFSPQSGSATSV